MGDFVVACCVCLSLGTEENPVGSGSEISAGAAHKRATYFGAFTLDYPVSQHSSDAFDNRQRPPGNRRYSSDNRRISPDGRRQPSDYNRRQPSGSRCKSI